LGKKNHTFSGGLPLYHKEVGFGSLTLD